MGADGTDPLTVFEQISDLLELVRERVRFLNFQQFAHRISAQRLKAFSRGIS